MEVTQEVPPTETQQEPSDIATEPTATQAPTRDVKTFWNRLDEVLAQFETEVPMNEKPYRSAVFQPDTVSLTSADAIQNNPIANVNTAFNAGHREAETFTEFKIRFSKALIGVKSIQCLSAVIPVATTNIPDTEIYFYYYRLRSLSQSFIGAWSAASTYRQGDVVSNTGNNYVSLIDSNLNKTPASNPSSWYLCTSILSYPNYYDLTTSYLNVVNFIPTYEQPADFYSSTLVNNVNRTFKDYSDLATALTFAGNATSTNLTATIPGDVSFTYDATLNKIVMVPNPTNVAAGYYYLPAGCLDPNVAIIQQGNFQSYINGKSNTLNLRCGFTWNGVFPNPANLANPFLSQQLKNALYWYLRPTDPSYIAGVRFAQNVIIANSYGDLVYTSCVKLYCDVTFGSTQDSTGQGGLLSIVPLSAGNLGVGFYQNNFYRPLTKLPDILPDITISMTTDNGSPYYLPNSADVTIELSIEYK